MFLDLFWSYRFGTQGTGWNHQWLWQQGAVKGRWLKVWRDSEIETCIIFPIFLWHTGTSAIVKTPQKRRLFNLDSYAQRNSFGRVLTVNCPLQPCPVKFNWTPCKATSSPSTLWWPPLFGSWRLWSLRKNVKIRLSAKFSKWTWCETAQS